MNKISQKCMFLSLVTLLILSGCGRLDTLPYDPPQTPQSWLQIQPYINAHMGGLKFIIVQPSTSAIVYLLGILTVGIGLHFLKIRAGQRSRLWWGIALILWGLGALVAGTSYEAFSYAIKCTGRESCLWTSWWEIAYLLLTVWSIDAMTVAMAWSGASGNLRKALTIYAFINAAVYLVLVLIGVFVPVKFLISFEFLLVVGFPSFLVFFVLNIWRYRKFKLNIDLAFIGAWLWLAVTVAAYFIAYRAGLTQAMWAKGIWFSENDVLHIFLILWMIYFAFIVPRVTDNLPAK
jgi:hypothetical protein